MRVFFIHPKSRVCVSPRACVLSSFRSPPYPYLKGSEEQKTAYALLNGYRDADADAIKAAVSKSAAVGFLEAPFARAAKKLPKPGHDLKEMSLRMGGDGGKITAGQSFLGGSGGSGGGGGDGGDEDDDDLT